VIGATTVDELLLADPHNVVRLILPKSAPQDAALAGGAPGTVESNRADPNEDAARRLRSWRDAGILVPDPDPSLYVYEQLAPGSRSGPGAAFPPVQRGLIGLVGVGDQQSSGIVPHEDVMAGPVRDRRDLMAATRANLEPIFLVYEGGASGSATTSLVNEVAERESPLVTAVTPDGITHRLWRLADPAQHAAIAADLASLTALIADGHHRYAAYRELQDLMSSGRRGGPWDLGLAFLVDANAFPPQLGAIHRVLPGLGPGDAARRGASAFKVHELGPGSLCEALQRLAEAGRRGTAFLVAGADGLATPGAVRYSLLTDPDRARAEAAMPAGASPRWRGLDAAVLQRLLMAQAWGIEDGEGVLVVHDAGEAVRSAVATDGVAVLSNPVPFGVVRDLAWHGERVPRKSTSFGPKPRSGLVLRGFDD
jgi:uncharacterized protein (DUF1015 family)